MDNYLQVKYSESYRYIRLIFKSAISSLIIFFLSTSYSKFTYALSKEKIDGLAEKVTVSISAGPGGGSGVIFDKRDGYYYVATAKHILGDFDEFIISTQEGRSYRATKVAKIRNIDLAILEFESSRDYKVADLGSSNSVKVGDDIYLGAKPIYSDTDQRPLWFASGSVRSIFPRPITGGLTIVIDRLSSIGGTSGGPLFDSNGKVIGLLGKGNYDSNGTTFYRYGLPVRSIKGANYQFALKTINSNSDTPIIFNPEQESPDLGENSKSKDQNVLLQLGSLASIDIDIFYYEKDIEAFEKAQILQRKLSDLGVLGIRPTRLRPYNFKLGNELNVCSWSEIRFDPEEVYEVSKLHILLRQLLPTEYFYLLELNPRRLDGITSNYLSIFLRSNIYPQYSNAGVEYCLGGWRDDFKHPRLNPTFKKTRNK